MNGDRARGIRRAAALVAALLVPLVVVACPGRTEKGRTYTVRGQIGQLPAPPAREIYLRHEAIDDFVDREGKVVGMDPMAMSFTVADDVPLAGLAVGDVVEFDLAVDWSEDRVRVTRVRKLPPGTRLVFRAAEPGRRG